MIWGYPNFRKPPHIYTILCHVGPHLVADSQLWTNEKVAEGVAILRLPVHSGKLIFPARFARSQELLWIQAPKSIEARKPVPLCSSLLSFWFHLIPFMAAGNEIWNERRMQHQKTPWTWVKSRHQNYLVNLRQNSPETIAFITKMWIMWCGFFLFHAGLHPSERRTNGSKAGEHRWTQTHSG